jgi:hypothetical protein
LFSSHVAWRWANQETLYCKHRETSHTYLCSEVKFASWFWSDPFQSSWPRSNGIGEFPSRQYRRS